MNFRTSRLILVLSITLIFTTNITAFNITRLLENHPDFSMFNDLLTQTGVAGPINARRTITVLVVANSDMSSVTNKAQSTIRYILSDHVILDYYDELKLGDLSRNKSGIIVTTLLQTTGVAQNKQGFLNVTVSGNDVIFGSAVKGAQRDSRMVQMVAAQPHNISVIQISQPIIAPGLEGFNNLPPSSSPDFTQDDSSLAPPPKKHSKKTPPSSDDDSDDTTDADADAPSDDTDDDDAKSPSGSSDDDDSSAADGGSDDSDHDKVSKDKNGGAKAVVGGGALVAALLGLVGI